MVTEYGLLWMAGGNDILATHFHLSLNEITEVMRVAVFVVPAVVFFVARAWCLGLQRADRDLLLHGRETGVITRGADGGYSERHMQLDAYSAYALTARDHPGVVPSQSETDTNGVRQRGAWRARVRHRLSTALYADQIPTPRQEELERSSPHDATQRRLAERDGVDL
jgi:ubiquinol-cytochrome c reductase cytochrome b subunit